MAFYPSASSRLNTPLMAQQVATNMDRAGFQTGPGMTYVANTANGGQHQSAVNSPLGTTLSSRGSSATNAPLQPMTVDTLASPYGMPPGMGGTAGPPSQGGIGTANSTMPTEMMTMYKNFLSDPSAMQNNPLYKAMMDQGLQATERAQLAGGMQGSGNIMAELQKTGMGIAGQYLPTMANMYGQGAGMEADRWAKQNAGQIGQGSLDLNRWQAASNDQFRRAQGNYGIMQDARAMNMADQNNAQFAPLLQQYMTMAASGY